MRKNLQKLRRANMISIHKLNGSIGCMVSCWFSDGNGYNKLYGEEPANFLDVGGALKKSYML